MKNKLLYCTRIISCSKKIITKKGKFCKQSDSRCEFQRKEKLIPFNYYCNHIKREYCKTKFFTKRKIKGDKK